MGIAGCISALDSYSDFSKNFAGKRSQYLITMKSIPNLSILAVALIMFIGCKKENNTDEGKNIFKIVFQHTNGDNDIQFNKMIYTNTAGNPYEVTEFMYFISNLRIYSNGLEVNPNAMNDIHYVDSKIPETMIWTVGNDINGGTYDSIKFTFGLSKEKNVSYLFVNPPEVLMAWPEVIGGGYHYLMLNGFWKDTADVRNPFNFHLGKGQIYENNSGDVSDIIGFIDNSFTVVPSGQRFTISDGKVTTLTLKMDVNSWFDSPNIFDFNVWGGGIMRNQEAMSIACENGKDAFSYSHNEGLIESEE